MRISFFSIEEVKETVLDFSQRTVKVFQFLFLKYKMAQNLNINLSNSQLNKLKLGIKNGTFRVGQDFKCCLIL